MLFFVLLTLVNLFSVNVIIWWSTFTLMVVFFIWLCKSECSGISLVNYFVIQETMGLFFLFFGGVIQYFILLLKCGVSPFHFWLFSVALDLKGLLFIWFLVFQKIPFIPVVLALSSYIFLFCLLLFGVFVCHIQYYSLGNMSGMLLISSTESFNWSLLFIMCSYYGFLVVVGLYLVFIWFVVANYWVMGGWELVLAFMNFPLGLVFIVKYFVISSFSSLFLFFFFLLFVTVVCSYLCFIIWFVFLSCKGGGYSFSDSYSWFVFFLFVFVVV